MPPATNPASVQAWLTRARQAKNLARNRRGTISSIQVFQAGPLAWLAAQYSDAATKTQAAARLDPTNHAATGISSSAAACKLTHSTTHFLYERARCKNHGVASCSDAPASIGSVATSPANRLARAQRQGERREIRLADADHHAERRGIAHAGSQIVAAAERGAVASERSRAREASEGEFPAKRGGPGGLGKRHGRLKLGGRLQCSATVCGQIRL